VITVVCFKHNENKFHSLYTFNINPKLENSDTLEQNDGQTYLELPAEVKFSLDAEFLAVTTFDGAVQLLRMPPVIDPMQAEVAAKATTPGQDSQMEGSKGTPNPSN
jgi:hypothetical protein